MIGSGEFGGIYPDKIASRSILTIFCGVDSLNEVIVVFLSDIFWFFDLNVCCKCVVWWYYLVYLAK